MHTTFRCLYVYTESTPDPLYYFLYPAFSSMFLPVVRPVLSAVSPIQAFRGDSLVLAITVGTPVNPALVKENFAWTYGSARVPQNGNNVEENGNLRLQSVQPSQTGVYTCTAVNTGGNGSATVRLDVLGEVFLRSWDLYWFRNKPKCIQSSSLFSQVVHRIGSWGLKLVSILQLFWSAGKSMQFGLSRGFFRDFSKQ